MSTNAILKLAGFAVVAVGVTLLARRYLNVEGMVDKINEVAPRVADDIAVAVGEVVDASTPVVIETVVTDTPPDA